MIKKEKIEEIVHKYLENEYYLVDVTVSKANVINVYIDSFDGVSIDKCVELSRKIEQTLDRDSEDFELQVSSPGLTQQFKIPKQFIKYIGKEIQVDTKDNKRLIGLITEADDEGFTFKTEELENVEGKKKKQNVERVYEFKYNEINAAKPVISFNK